MSEDKLTEEEMEAILAKPLESIMRKLMHASSIADNYRASNVINEVSQEILDIFLLIGMDQAKINQIAEKVARSIVTARARGELN